MTILGTGNIGTSIRKSEPDTKGMGARRYGVWWHRSGCGAKTDEKYYFSLTITKINSSYIY